MAFDPNSARPVGEFDPSTATPYVEKPGATVGGVARTLAGSAVDSIGHIISGVGELGQGIADRIGGAGPGVTKPAWDALKQSGEGVRMLSNDFIKSGMSEGDKAATQDSLGGDFLSPSTWTFPKTGGGWAHGIAQGLGSTVPMVVGGAAGVGSRAIAPIMSATGGLMTAGAAADDVRQNFDKMTPEQWDTVPAYRDLIAKGMQPDLARKKIVDDSAFASAGLSGVAGAIGGGVEGKVIGDLVVGKGVSKALGNAAESTAGRAALGGIAGTAGEAIQETSEKVGQNIGENIGRGDPAMMNPTRDTFGDAVLGGITGGAIGTVGGMAAKPSAPSPTPTQPPAPPSGPLGKVLAAGGIAAGLQADARLAQLVDEEHGTSDTWTSAPPVASVSTASPAPKLTPAQIEANRLALEQEQSQEEITHNAETAPAQSAQPTTKENGNETRQKAQVLTPTAGAAQTQPAAPAAPVSAGQQVKPTDKPKVYFADWLKAVGEPVPKVGTKQHEDLQHAYQAWLKKYPNGFDAPPASTDASAAASQKAPAVPAVTPEPTATPPSAESAGAPELVKVRTRFGDTTHVRKSDLDSGKTMLRQYSASGKPKTGATGLHRDNIDQDGSKQAADNAATADNPLFDVITLKDGRPYASENAAKQGAKKHGVTETHEPVALPDGKGFVLRRKAQQPKEQANAQASEAKQTAPERAAEAEAGRLNRQDEPPIRQAEPENSTAQSDPIRAAVKRRIEAAGKVAAAAGLNPEGSVGNEWALGEITLWANAGKNGSDSFLLSRLGEDGNYEYSEHDNIADAERVLSQWIQPKQTAHKNATAPEHVQSEDTAGVTVDELKKIAAEFRKHIDNGGDAKTTHVFDAPEKSEIVRLQDKTRVHVSGKGWMTPAEAKAEIAKWKENAQSQYDDRKIANANNQKVVLSLFDLSGEWSKPWEEAGYQVYRFDIQSDPDMGDVNNFSTEFFNDWFSDFEGQEVYAILAACPCTDFAVSGARHFAAKDEDGRTVSSIKLVKKTLAAIEYFRPAVWALENPVGRIESLTGLPPWRLSFDPNHLGDTYTKKTLIWGRFNADLPIAPVEPVEGSKMHTQYGGKSQATKNARSVTPEGFAYGFFQANNAHDNPVLAVFGKYDRLDRDLIGKAIDAGVTPEQIDNAVEDFYYMDLDDAAANQAIQDLIDQSPDGGKKTGKHSESTNSTPTAQTLVDAAAHEAATSPNNDKTEPTPAQKEAGNYAKGHVSLHGLNISIENPKGSERVAKDESWRVTMPAHYGYIKGTVGADKDHVDVFIGPNPESKHVWIVNQIVADSSPAKFDEHKVMMGFRSAEEAKGAYLLSFEGSFGARVFGSMTEALTIDQLKAKIDAGELSRKTPTGPVTGATTTRDKAAEAADAEKDANKAKLEATRERRETAAAGDQYADKWFGSEEKANAFIAKNGIGETHQVMESATGRYVIAQKPKAEESNSAAINAESMTREDAIAALVDGKKLERYGDVTWIEETQAGKVQTYVIKTRTDSGGIITKGPAGPDRQWGWGRLDAAQKAIESWKFGAAKPAEDLGAMFDDLMGEIGAGKEVSKAANRNKLAETKKKREPKQQMKRVYNDDGSYYNAPVESPRTAGQAAASAAKNTAEGFQNAIAGLGKLFGGNGRLSSGLTFDEHTYQQAKPLFSAAVANFKQAGADLKDVMKAVMLAVREQFGDAALGNMKPYVVRFIEDVRDGKVSYDEGKEGVSNGNNDATGSEGSEALGEVAAGADGGTESRGDVRGGNDGSGKARKGRNGNADGAGVPRTRSGRGRASDVHSAETGTGDRVDSPAPDLFSAPTNIPAANFEITADVDLGKGSEAVKFGDNIAAIETLKTLERENRRATPEEQRTLARYVGWGGLSNAFADNEGNFKPGWEAKGKQLADLLTDAELKAARRSTRNAHYTSETIVRGMWSAAERLGFKGGMVLEPSSGTGNFLGMAPKSIAAKFLGVEFDSLTARIAQALYPQATILHSGFQKVALPDNVVDMAIGNPPFGSESLRFQFKPELNGASIHNQFFRASMDAVKPGGLQIMVVSRYLMDAQDNSTRAALARQAKLLGVIRLPDTAFKENARTEVVTDIVFLQKLTAVEQAEMNAAFEAKRSKPEKDAGKEAERRALAEKVPSWIETTSVPDPLGGEPMTVNRYVADHPEMILGALERSGSMRYENDITVRLDKSADMTAMLDKAISQLPANVMNQEAGIQEGIEEAYSLLSDALRIQVAGLEAGDIRVDNDGSLFEVIEREGPNESYLLAKRTLTPESPWSARLAMDQKGQWYEIVVKKDAAGNSVKKLDKDGKPTKFNDFEKLVYGADENVPKTLRIGESRFERLFKLVKIRDLLKNQLVLESEDATAAKMEDNRARLNAAYDAFVAAHEHISARANESLISEMPDGALLLALEMGYRPAITAAKAKKMGESPRSADAKKAAILTERVVVPYSPPDKAASPADALVISMAEAGKVDLDRISKLLDTNEEGAIAALHGDLEKPLIFQDPETREWQIADQYLSGQVKRKLAAAQAAGMSKNVEALEKVQPEAWGADQVTAVLGGTWIPEQTYADFIKHLTGSDGRVRFSAATNSFDVTVPSTAQGKEWSTDDAGLQYILGQLLNSASIRLTYTDSEGKSHFMPEETALAQMKAKQIEAEFGDWIFADATRRAMLVERFNEKFNTRVTRQHDGSHLILPGKVPDMIIEMRRHQKNAIWRGIQERFMLLDHVVGAGKTFTAIARAMERRRMGLSKKPGITVPNHMVEQFAADAYRLYPGAKILAAGKKDFEKKNRRKLFAKIATGDWDLVIVPHSSFKFISISPEAAERYLDEEIKLAEAAIEEAWEQAKEDGTDNGWRKPFNVKQAEALREKLEARRDKLKHDTADRLLTFEQLGIDDLTVDEAHEFKNLYYSSRMTGVRGMGDRAGSEKAYDLYQKVRVLRDSPTGSVVFMTGTPISNSAVEMYTMMRYLAAGDLADLGLEHFDAWRANFVDAEAAWEPTESGGLKQVTRLGRSWSNMRSLMDLYYSFTDAVSLDDIKQWYKEDNDGKEFPVPAVKSGDRQSVVVKPTEAQISFLNEIVAGFNGLEDIEDVNERNAERLRLMDRARKLSLDARAVNSSVVSDEKGGKLERVSDEVKRIYDQWSADRGTQLVFLDRSVPKSKGDDKIIKEYDKIVAERDDAMRSGDEAAYRAAVEKLDKYDANEIRELRNAQTGGWNAYQQIKDHLVARGIPANEIRFVQEANTDEQKQALFDSVNAGEVRVLIGSTPRMGAGTNVQQRLVALHHVDVTWKPSDIEQREGRIIRQGNKLLDKYGQGNFEVEILAYATERTMDAKMWDLNATKLRTINGIRKYSGEFTMEFEDEDAVGMAELAALASGDPLLIERVKIESELDRLELLNRAWRRKVFAIRDRVDFAERDIEEIPKQIAAIPAKIERAQADADAIGAEIKRAEDAQASARLSVEGVQYASHMEAMTAATAAIEKQRDGNEKARFSIEVGGERVTSKDALESAMHSAFGDTNPVMITVAGKSFNQRGAAAKAIIAEASRIGAKVSNDNKQASDRIGQWYGMNLEADVSRKYGGEVTLTLSLVAKDGRTLASEESQPLKEEKFFSAEFSPQSVRSLFEKIEREMKARADFTPQYWNDEIRRLERKLEQTKADFPKLREQAANSAFPQAGEMAEKQARLEEIIRALASVTDAAKAAAKDNDANMASRPVDPMTPAKVNPYLERWAANVLAKNRNISPVMPILRDPPNVLKLAGIYRPIVIDMEHAGHAMNVHPEVMPADIGALPDLLSRPRAVMKHQDGWRVVVDSRDPSGQPLSVALSNDTIQSGKERLKVTEVSTLFGTEESARMVVQAIERGDMIYMPQKEIGRLTDLLPTPQLRTQAGESQPPTNRISDRQFRILSDDALVNFGMSGEPQTTEITLPENAVKLMDGKLFSRPDEARNFGATVADTRAEIAASIGEKTLAAIESKGLLEIHKDTSALPGAPADAWGWFDGNTVNLVAGNMAPGQSVGVFKHEVWHRMLRVLRLSESPLYAKLMDRLAKIESNSVHPEWFANAQQMIPSADLVPSALADALKDIEAKGTAKLWFDGTKSLWKGDFNKLGQMAMRQFNRDAKALPAPVRMAIAKSQKDINARRLNETAAYAVQQYETAPESLPMLIRRWAADLVAAVRAFFMDQFGMVPKNLTDADLSALTQRYLKSMASNDDVGVLGGEGMAARSNQIQTPEFKRWFGDSKVVDESGSPMVVYHGTHVRPLRDGRMKGDVTSFDRLFTTNFRAHSLDTVGSWFSTNPGKDGAAMYAGGTDGSMIYPVYLSIKNPHNTTFQLLSRRGRLLANGKDDGRMLGKAEVDALRKWLSDMGKDGIHITHDPGAANASTEFEKQDAWIALEPNQIKSATGNRGTFDPNNDDILFSRPALVQRVTDRAADLFQSSKTFNLWHKTVGTQFHKASVDPQFGRVFKIGQRFLQDTSQFAMDAADQAPDLLPKLGSIKDIFKRGPSAADREAVAQVVFAGTIEDHVYSDEELQSLGLTDKQRAYYREFRAATDKSIDDLFVSELVRSTRDQLPMLGRSLVGMSARQAHDTVTGMLRDQVAALERDAAMTESEAAINKINGQIKTLKEDIAEIGKKAEKIQKLKADGYAPLMRFGQYTVDVMETDEMGEPSRVFFGMFETQREANAAARDWRKANGGQYEVTQGVMSQEDWRMFNGVSPDSMELFAEALGVDESAVFQEYLKRTLNNRSALKRLIQRKEIPGFSQDVTRVLATFITSNSRLAARNLNLMPMAEAVTAIPKEKGDVKDEAVRLAEYLTDPKEEAQALRGWLFAHFLGGSIASAMTNMTQPVTMTAPYLGQFGNAAAAKAMAFAATVQHKKLTGNTRLDAALRKAEAEGITAPHEIHQLYAESIRSFGSNLFMRKAMTAWGSMFALAESFNRRLTFIAAFKMAQENPSLGHPFAFAEKAVEETQGIYNKGNRPDWARGAIGATVFTFKQFSVSYIEFLKRLPPKQRALALAVLFIAAGLQGWPFAEDAEDLIDTIGQSFGYDTNSKRWLHEFAVRNLGEGFGEFAINGFSAIPGMPLDVQARMGLGNLIPGSAMFKPSEQDRSRDVLEFVGPAGALAKSAMDSMAALQRGDLFEAIRAPMPVAVKNGMKAAEMGVTGEYRDGKGRKVMNVDGWDTAIKAVGFQPSAVAKESRRTFEAKQSVDMAKKVEADISDKWAHGIIDKNPDAVREARADLAEWNAKNPESRIAITPQQIFRRVKEARMTREQRFIKTVPKEMRRDIASGLRG